MNSLKVISQLGLVSVALCLNCSFDDRELKEQDGDAGETGTGGSKGGSGGKGGTGGTNSAGKGGSSAGTTAAGTSGSGGTGAVTSEFVDCNGDALEPDMDAVKACLFHIGCDPLFATMTLSYCITYQYLKTFSRYDCGSGVDSCDDYLGCRTWGYYDSAECGAGDPPYCDGDYAVFCGNGGAWAKNCAAVGGVCQTYTDADGNPSAWCRQPLVTDTCMDATAGEPACQEQIAYACTGGYPLGVDCETTGTDCVVTEDGAVCRYPLPSCTTPGVSCSTDTRVEACFDSLEQANFYCASGLGCEEIDSDVYCLAPGCDETSPCEESCDGTELTLCYGSTPITVDCADYGFSECLETTLSDETTPSARCFGPARASAN